LVARGIRNPTPKDITHTEMTVVKTAGNPPQVIFKVNLLDQNDVNGWSNKNPDEVEDYKGSKNNNVGGLANQNMVDIYATLINYMSATTIKLWWGQCYEGKTPGTKKEALRDLADFLANIRK